MKVINSFSMTIVNDLDNKEIPVVAIERFIFSYDTTTETIKDIKTAVLEAINNCVMHSGSEKIFITVKLYENYVIKITIRDNGCGIEDIEKAMEPLYSTKNKNCAGLGFTVMQSFCDKVSVKSTLGKGTTVNLSKNLKKDF